jgi:hypothetical protein
MVVGDAVRDASLDNGRQYGQLASAGQEASTSSTEVSTSASAQAGTNGGMDLAPNVAVIRGQGTLNLVPSAEAVEFLGMTAYVDINWSKNWTSSLVSSFTKVDNASFQEAASSHKREYASGNNLWHRLKMC